jgi:hypothetical protein
MEIIEFTLVDIEDFKNLSKDEQIAMLKKMRKKYGVKEILKRWGLNNMNGYYRLLNKLEIYNDVVSVRSSWPNLIDNKNQDKINNSLKYQFSGILQVQEIVTELDCLKEFLKNKNGQLFNIRFVLLDA